jgi:thiol-disulfide isomerase/thioredoxin
MGAAIKLFICCISTLIIFMKTNKIIFLSILATVILGVTILSFKIWYTLKQKNKSKIATQYLPSIQLRKTDGTILFTESFKDSNELLVLNFFNPDCDHCQSMVQQLFQEQKLLEKLNWLMITSASVEKTKRFTDSFNIAQLKNVIVLNDSDFLFSKTFGTVSFPSFYVYKKGLLLRKHIGECSVAFLVKD